MDQRHALTELICRSCMALDDRKFADYLDLCDPAFRYRITAYSPEIRKDMTWLEHDKAGMQSLFTNLPRHNSDQSPLTRHVTVYVVKQDDAARRAQVLSALQVFKTTLDGGSTELYAVGKVHDEIALTDDGPRLLDRNVRLETRQLGIGYHIPF